MEIFHSPWTLTVFPSSLNTFCICSKECRKHSFGDKYLKEPWKIARSRGLLLTIWRRQQYLAQWFRYSFLPFFSPKVWIALNVGINARNYAALLYSNEDRAKWIFPFPWRYGHNTLKCSKCGKKHFSSWFNRRNSNACTHSNVRPLAHDFTKGLGHDSTKWWQSKWSSATSLFPLWEIPPIKKSSNRWLELQEWGWSWRINAKQVQECWLWVYIDFVRLLGWIWKTWKEIQQLAQYLALLISSLCYFKMSLKLSTYTIHSLILITHRTLSQMSS